MDSTMIEAIKKAEKLAKSSARAWERGNNSGDPTILEEQERIAGKKQREAIASVKPYGITLDFGVGLYPTYEYKGHTYYTPDELIKWGIEK